MHLHVFMLQCTYCGAETRFHFNRRPVCLVCLFCVNIIGPGNKPANSEERTASIGDPLARPSHDEIARLAYALWEARGCGEGSAEQDWLEAERRLRAPWMGRSE
jgi:hypothetical protein